ncbi:MAG: hypothetical protein OHK0039_33150 [Bacteroidia bacterium]
MPALFVMYLWPCLDFAQASEARQDVLRRHPGITHVVQTIHTNTICFSFLLDGRSARAVYDPVGTWQGTLVELTPGDPAARHWQRVFAPGRVLLTVFRIESPFTLYPVYAVYGLPESTMHSLPPHVLAGADLLAQEAGYLIDARHATHLSETTVRFLVAFFHGSGRPLDALELKALLQGGVVPYLRDAPRAPELQAGEPDDSPGWYPGTDW